jgi:hypothetical protein
MIRFEVAVEGTWLCWGGGFFVAKFGYFRVPDTAFVAFARDLAQGAWAAVASHPVPFTDPGFVASLMDAPLLVGLKARALYDIDFLSHCLLIGVTETDRADNEWDTSQRLLHLDLAREELSPDLARRAAAQRLRVSLLKGGTTAQTRYSLDDEVDFGRYQGKTALNREVAADITLLELGARMTEIGERTETLATLIGRDARKGKRLSRSSKLRQATSTCVGTCSAIHDQLDWLLDRLPPDASREQLDALRAPFLDLLARHPKAPDEEPPSALPSPPDTPPPS